MSSINSETYTIPDFSNPETLDLSTIQNAPLGQKPTSYYKPTVYMLPDKVIKGPFQDHQKNRVMLLLLYFRHHVFSKVWKSKVSGPFTLLKSGSNFYISMDLLKSKINNVVKSSEPVDILGNKKARIIDKESMGIQELPKYFDSVIKSESNNVIIRDSLFHMIHRFIIDPIVGDNPLRNILVVDSEYSVGIDYDCLQVDQNPDESQSLWVLLSGGKTWAKKYLEIFKEYILLNKQELIDHLDFLENTLINDIPDIVVKFGLLKVVDLNKSLKRLRLVRTKIV